MGVLLRPHTVGERYDDRAWYGAGVPLGVDQVVWVVPLYGCLSRLAKLGRVQPIFSGPW